MHTLINKNCKKIAIESYNYCSFLVLFTLFNYYCSVSIRHASKAKVVSTPLGNPHSWSKLQSSHMDTDLSWLTRYNLVTS